MSLAQRIVEEGETTRDAYELAGCARFTPRLEDMQAGLKRLAAENAPYIAHWQKETRAKGQRLQQQIEQAQQVFAAPVNRERYDEQLLSQLRQAYAREMAGQTGEPLRRWLRLAQNIHGTRIEDIARKLTDVKAASSPTAASKIPAAVVMSTAPVEVKAPQPVSATVTNAAKPRTAPRPPVRKKKPDDFALMWIVGSAAATAIVALFALLYIFRDSFGGAEPGSVAQASSEEVSAPPVETPEPMQVTPEPTEEPVASAPPMKSTPVTPAPATTNPPAPSPTKTPEQSPPQPAPPIPSPPPMPAEMATSPAPAQITSPAATADGRQQIAFGRAIHSLAWDGSGQQLAVAGEGSDVLIWDAAKGTEGKRLQETFTAATGLSFGAGGRSLAVATSDSTVFIWNVASAKLERTLRHADLNDPRAIVWIPGQGEAQLLIGDGSGMLQTFSVTNNNPVSTLELGAEAGAIQAISYSSKRPVAVCAHLDGTVVVWNVTGKSLLKCLLNPDAAIVKTLSGSGASSSKAAELTHWSHEVCFDVALSPDETLLAVAATDLEIWEFDSARHLVRRRLLPGVPGAKAYRVVDFSSDGNLLAAGNAEGSLVIVDVASWTVVVREKLASAVLSLAWHPSDPRQLAVGQENGQGTIIPLAKNIQTLKATPDFDVEKLLETLKELVDDENWFDASRLLAVLSSYQLPLTARTDIDRYRGALRKGAQQLVDEVDPKAVKEEDLGEAADNLQLAIDVDSQGKLGKEARAKMRLLPVRTPATLAQLAAAEAAAAKARPANNAAQPNRPPFPFAPPGFNPNVRKRP